MVGDRQAYRSGAIPRGMPAAVASDRRQRLQADPRLTQVVRLARQYLHFPSHRLVQLVEGPLAWPYRAAETSARKSNPVNADQ